MTLSCLNHIRIAWYVSRVRKNVYSILLLWENNEIFFILSFTFNNNNNKSLFLKKSVTIGKAGMLGNEVIILQSANNFTQ